MGFSFFLLFAMCYIKNKILDYRFYVLGIREFCSFYELKSHSKKYLIVKQQLFFNRVDFIFLAW